MKWRKFFGAVLPLSVLGMAAYFALSGYDPAQRGVAEKILRFHVVANSDSAEDQEVKLAVRDAVGAFLEPMLSGSKTRAQTEEVVRDNLWTIVETAETVLAENGFSYGVTAALSDTEFPVRSYGDYTFPAGTYRALNITLGSGQGHNWWCVLYPNMCFQDSVYGITDDSGKALREILTQEEYADIFRTGKFRIRLKFLDYFRAE